MNVSYDDNDDDDDSIGDAMGNKSKIVFVLREHLEKKGEE